MQHISTSLIQCKRRRRSRKWLICQYHGKLMHFIIWKIDSGQQIFCCLRSHFYSFYRNQLDRLLDFTLALVIAFTTRVAFTTTGQSYCLKKKLCSTLKCAFWERVIRKKNNGWVPVAKLLFKYENNLIIFAFSILKSCWFSNNSVSPLWIINVWHCADM